MKANAPEKLYIDFRDRAESTWRCAYTEKALANDIEYIRPDAFIEKALAYLNSKFYFNNLHYAVENNTFNCMEEMFEDFRKYMEGE